MAHGTGADRDPDPAAGPRPAAPVRVVIVDDEALVRSGFQMILGRAPDIEVVGTGDGEQAVGLVRDLRPDVVLLDIRMPVRDGLSILSELRRLPDPPRVAMLTTFDTDEHIAEALDRGASGFLLKDTDPEALPTYVRTLASGGMVLGSTVGARVVSVLRSAAPASSREAELVNSLTSRELLVLRLVCDGLSNSQIGSRLHLSVGTIKDHVSSILMKLQVSTRVQAVLIAERSQIFTESGDGA